MLDFLVSWAEQLIIALIIIVIIEMVLPSGNNYKKYIKVILGIFLLYTVITPIITKQINPNKLQEVISNSYTENKIEPQNILNYDKQIEETYKIKFKENLNEFLKENGYEISKLEQNIEYKQENIEIKSINLKVKKYIKEDEIKIEKIDINKKSEISENELEEIKNKISQNYEIEKNKITIESEKSND